MPASHRAVWLWVLSAWLAIGLRPAATAQKLKEYVTISGLLRPQPGSRGPIAFGPTRNDLFSLRKMLPAAKNAIALRTMGRQMASYADVSRDVTLIGCSPKLAELAGIRVTKGRFFTAAEANQADNVCVIGNRLSLQLFADANPIGRNLRIGRQYFLVVGVVRSAKVELISVTEAVTGKNNLRTRNGLSAATTSSKEVYIPLRAMKSRFGDVQIARGSGTFEGRRFQLSEIWIPGVTARDEEQIRLLMRRRHDSKVDYRVRRRSAY